MPLQNVRNLRRQWTRFAWASAVTTLLLSGAAQKANAQARPAESLPPAPAEAAATPAAPAAPAAAQTIPVYTLQDCIRIAYEKQPALAAARASFAAKQATSNGLANTPNIACLVSPDLKIRKAQAFRGLSAAQAQVLQAECETTYAVTRTYYTAIYARMQFDVASDVVENLKFYRNLVQEIIRAGSDRDINQTTLDRLDIYMNLAQSKRTDAEEGVQRALAALREAMGIGLECSSFQLADLRLPEPAVVPEKCDIVNLALSRRGEMTAVLVAADVVRLEVDAQGKHLFRNRVGTFAIANDIHATPVPPGIRNGEYRPGAIGPEMPVNLVGNRRTRVDTAAAYSSRADAVVAKTRELIALEAEDGFLKWLESSRKVASSREAATVARRLSKNTRDDANRGARIKQEDILMTDVLAGQAIAAYHEAVFHQVIALAGLERLTAGGFAAGLGSNP